VSHHQQQFSSAFQFDETVLHCICMLCCNAGNKKETTIPNIHPYRIYFDRPRLLPVLTGRRATRKASAREPERQRGSEGRRKKERGTREKERQ
jgi:hypothetical protein